MFVRFAKCFLILPVGRISPCACFVPNINTFGTKLQGRDRLTHVSPYGIMPLIMEACYKKLIKSIGENVNRPGLKETPRRAALAFEYLTGGYNQDVRKVINNALFPVRQR